jgi:D-3-phosphoglycerate dehydrogenase
MKKVLTSPSSMGQCGSEPFDLLRENNYEIINNPYGRKLTEDEVIELAKDCVGIVAGVEPLTARVMDALPLLRCISSVGVGMDSVDLEYAKQKGIIVVNTPEGPTRGVEELNLAMTL